ncbi:MAG TPA: AI-2E family transporter [Ornithinimicrobium sp.]|uniref:AI-2E family transporter n=1 Tax=Ornithinimicrobium sp. TaxID=1977084 RepID=UPI002B48B926|nr:AI-2E family transporter [Ornithinimicrobium sp.]HKJ12304.1 AI-2E family transporter [Ornithinimicrobium sp.]
MNADNGASGGQTRPAVGVSSQERTEDTPPAGAQTGASPVPLEDRADRAEVLGAWLNVLARWSWRLIVAALGVVLLLWGLSFLWGGLLPVILALILTALLSPFAHALHRWGLGMTLASALTLLIAVMVIVGSFVFIVPGIAAQFREVASAASDGLAQLQDWLAGEPFNVSTGEMDDLVQQSISWVQQRGGAIASGAFSGVSAISSVVVNTVLVLALTFFFLKDGHRFPAWQRSVVGRGAGRHLTEVLARNWKVLGGFIRTQALVSAIDAALIGMGLLVLGVPLAGALAVITFFAGFIPIVGAISAGALAVLVALVTNGWQTALAVLVIILLVQQLEGNVLSPWLQGKTMQVHAALILVSITIGGTLFGIIGVFLAVPFTACLMASARYASEQLDLRTGDATAEQVLTHTSYGREAAQDGERRAALYRQHTLTLPASERGGELSAEDETPDQAEPVEADASPKQAERDPARP